MLQESLNKWLKIDPIAIIRKILSDRSIIKFITDANKSQLLSGKNSLDVKLSDIGGNYSEFTLQLHPEKTKDIINLYDSGDFHDSITIQLDNDLFEITADSIKTDDNGRQTDLFKEWGTDILGLNENNFNKLLTIIKDALILHILQKV